MILLFTIFGVACILWGIILVANLFDAAERAAAGYRERASGVAMQTVRGQRLAGVAMIAVGIVVVVIAPLAG